ncbi:beta strand repeat-containing protein [Deinococcus sp. A31D244]|uniref:beta strand repeat-containing protein n=1 Tax=Deinococcus sp. A31D244 TaxID=3397675 RepID=UPI0039DF5DEF
MKHRSLMLAAFLALGAASAAGTTAGTQITNQASAAYRDASGTKLDANSNQVSTLVKQVAGVTISPDGTPAAPGQQQQAVPGAEVVFPYTLTNTGNGPDTFSIDTVVDSTVANTVAPATRVVYIDANGDGILQPGERVALPQVSGKVQFQNVIADAQVKFFVVLQVPSNATSVNKVIIQPTAVSTFDATKTDGVTSSTNYAQANVVQDAVLSVSKSVVSSTTESNGDLTVVFRIQSTNTGTQTATNVTLADDIISAASTLPTGSVVKAASATVSPATGVVSYPNDDADSNANDQVKAVFASVAPGQSVQLSFTATIPAAAAPTTSQNPYRNVATVTYTGSTGTVTTTASNTADVTKAPTAAVAIGPNGDPLGAADPTTGATYTSAEGLTITPDNTDKQTVASLAAGSTVTFTQTVRNTGNSTDTFDLTAALNDLPAGTSVELLRDGVSLTDTDGSGKPDSGPLAPGQSTNIQVRVRVPAQAGADVNGGTVVVTATSKVSPARTDVTTDTITAVTAPSVSLGNTSPSNGGTPATVANTNVLPGNQATFTVEVGNNGAQPDNYNLSGTVTFPTSTPTGATTTTVNVVYYKDLNGDGVLDANELAAGPITNTGTIQPGQEIKLIGVVTTPTTALPGTVTVTQTASSPVTNTTGTDNNDTVTVLQVYDIALTPDRSGTTTSPGTALYQHTLQNDGNTSFSPADLTFTSTPSGATSGWTYLYSLDGTTFFSTVGAAFSDASTRNLLGTTSPATLDPGEKVTLSVKINVPAGAPTESINQLTLTAATTPASPATGAVSRDPGSNPARVTDTTRVVGGKLAIDKTVDNCANDVTCAVIKSGADAFPGEYLRYTLAARNLSTDTLTEVVLRDTVPANTVLAGVSGPARGFYRISGGAWTAVATAPVAQNAGTLIEFAVDTDGNGSIDATETSLTSGSSVTFTLTVRVN